MEKFNKEGKTQYTQNNFNILPYINKVKYPPQPIHSFSPYKEDSDLHDIISTTRDIRGNIETLEPIQKIKITEAEELMKRKYEEIINHGKLEKYICFHYQLQSVRQSVLQKPRRRLLCQLMI